MNLSAAPRRSVIFLALTAIVVGAGCGHRPDATHLEARRLDDWRQTQLAAFDKVWQTIHDRHYDPTFGGLDWNAVRAELRPKVERAETDAEVEAVLNDLVHRLKLSHFGILAPGTQSPAARTEGQDVFVPSLARDVPADKVKFGNLPELPLRATYQRLPNDNVGYFYLSIFLDPPKVMPTYHKAIDDARSADGLIIDLRQNPGGVGIMAIGIGNSLVDKPDLKLGTMIQREGELKFVLNPQAEPYTKPVAILIDDHTGSTAEIFAQGMQDIGRARVFGQRSAGQALPSFIEKLPNGYLFQYAVANYVSTNGKTLEGNGVTPDEIVENPKPDDQNDPVVAAAVKWIKSQAEQNQ